MFKPSKQGQLYGGSTLNPHESTAANADIWARYLQEQWGRWLTPPGASTPISEIVEGAAANVASFLTLFASAPIAWLFNTNASYVDESVRGQLEPVRIHANEDGIAA